MTSNNKLLPIITNLRNFKTRLYLYKITLACLAIFIINLIFNCTKADEIKSNDKFLLDAATVTSPKPDYTLSLKDAFSIGNDNNYDIVVAKKNLNIAYAQVIVAKAIPNPQFQAQLGFGPAFSYLFTGQTQQILFTEQILTAGKRTKKINLALANLELAKLNLNSLTFKVHNQIRRAYAELVAANAYEDLIDSQRNIAQKLLDVAQKRYKAGKSAYSEVLQAQLNVLQFEPSQNQAQPRIQQASCNLALLIGKKIDKIELFEITENGIFQLSAQKTEIVPSPDKELPDIKDLILKAYSVRPDLLSATQEVFANHRAFTLAQAQRIPDLFLAAGYAFTAFAANQPAGLSPAPAQPGVFIALNANTPVFYQNQGEIAQAKDIVRQSQLKIDLLKSQIARDVVNSTTSVNVARANIYNYSQNLLPLSAHVAKLARRGYEVGISDLSSAIVAQQQYQQTLSNYFDVVVNYQNAWADLEQAVGLPLKF